MFSRAVVNPVIVNFLLIALFAITRGAYSAPLSSSSPGTEDYIIIFKSGVNVATKAQDIARRFNTKSRYQYTKVFHGLSARLPTPAIEALKKDPDIGIIEKSVPFKLHVQDLPTGVDRIDSELSQIANINGLDERVDIDVAIIDTGIDLDHSDLNVYKYAYCFQQNPFSGTCNEGDINADDAIGHGTHVAGIVGALDNDYGVVGVVPGARLWALDVTKADGTMTTLEIIAALDYVMANSAEIEVVNMSLGFNGSSQALDQAIASVVNAGVVIVTSAGNDAIDVAGVSPAGNPDVITVSAFADFDGLSGSMNDLGYIYNIASGQCTENVDDSFACFSNYGSGVDVMAPGTKILSTYPNDTYVELHGTSMSSPHVAGVAALYLAEHPDSTPADVKSYLIANGSNTPCGELPGQCSDDPDTYHEPLILAAKDQPIYDEGIPFLPGWAYLILFPAFIMLGSRVSR
ncbi:MAG: S8 family serine peptidase [Gammaproteobacteria bacterium]|nr:S8 family serine peptidase [Gammaproteobacteria bacterium]